jgi:orotate phosphoribosyltransferase
VQEVQRDNGIPVISIADLAGLVRYLDDAPELVSHKRAIEQYRAQYGV